MEKIPCICVMRELSVALSSLENSLLEHHGVSFNEAMVMCAVGSESVLPTFVSEQTGISPSNTSKLLNSLEKKGLISRSLGKPDRRSVMVSLTAAGADRLQQIKYFKFEIPPVLKNLFS